MSIVELPVDPYFTTSCWKGTVVSGAEWRSNETATKDDDSSSPDWKGYAWRCKVRIHGLDTTDQTKLPDNDLPWVPISNATNAGSGKGDSSSHAINPGDTVIGMWLHDGVSQPMYPIIIGVLQTTANLSDLDRSQNTGEGYKEFDETLNNKVPATQETPNGTVRPTPQGPSKQKTNERNDSDTLSIPCPKKEGNATGSVSKVQQAINSVNSLKNDVNKTTGQWINDINNTNAAIQREINKASEWLSGQISKIIKKILEWVTKKVNGAGQVASVLLPLNTRFSIREAQNIIIEALFCMFNKLLNALTDLIADWLKNLINNYVAVPLCVIENMLSNLLGQLLAAISGLLNNIAGAITGLIGGVTNLINEVLDFISNLLELFNCDPEDDCDEDKEWNILDAGSSTAFGFNLDINGVVNAAKSVAQSFESTFANLTSGDLFDPLTQFDLNAAFGSAYSTCSGAPLVCGPPKVGFWGGSPLLPALATPIIGASGGVISVSITNPGFGYGSVPYVSFVDPCGLGAGAVGYAVTGPGGTITGVVITSPGTGYIGSPSGAIGGGGTVFGAPGAVLAIAPAAIAVAAGATVGVGTTTLTVPSYSAFSPGVVGSAFSGTTLSLSGFSSSPMSLVSPTSTTLLSPGFSTTLTTNVTFTVPPVSSSLKGPFPSLGASYPVILYLCDIKIKNPGIGYKDTDEVIITPDNGAKAELIVGSFGEITAINIIDGGFGFTNSPTITIKSSTGYNAQLIPVLCSSKVGDDLNDLFGGIDGGLGVDEIDPDKIIQVIDCVGNVPIV
jgi:hypothetical protein